jgi:hypothetical protein
MYTPADRRRWSAKAKKQKKTGLRLRAKENMPDYALELMEKEWTRAGRVKI